MALLHEAVEEKKFDVRCFEKGMARGTLSGEEVKRWLSSLPDESDNADWVTLEEVAARESSGDESRGEPRLGNGKY